MQFKKKIFCIGTVYTYMGNKNSYNFDYSNNLISLVQCTSITAGVSELHADL